MPRSLVPRKIEIMEIQNASTHKFRALSILDGDLDIPEEALDAVTAFSQEQIAGLVLKFCSFFHFLAYLVVGLRICL